MEVEEIEMTDLSGEKCGATAGARDNYEHQFPYSNSGVHTFVTLILTTRQSRLCTKISKWIEQCLTLVNHHVAKVNSVLDK
jgi:hypothetical protein